MPGPRRTGRCWGGGGEVGSVRCGWAAVAGADRASPGDARPSELLSAPDRRTILRSRPAVANPGATLRPRPSAPSTAQRRCGQVVAHSCNWHTVVAVTATLIVATGCAVESTATAVSELLCGSIPIVIMHSLPSRDGINPATGTLTLSRSMPLLSHVTGRRRSAARYGRASQGRRQGASEPTSRRPRHAMGRRPSGLIHIQQVRGISPYDPQHQTLGHITSYIGSQLFRARIG